MLCFKYHLILSYLYSLESHLCSRFMYLKTAEVWLRTSRLGQIVFRIYSVEQLLLYCDLRDFYLLQSPPSLRWAALLVTALRYLPAYREPFSNLSGPGQNRLQRRNTWSTSGMCVDVSEKEDTTLAERSPTCS